MNKDYEIFTDQYGMNQIKFSGQKICELKETVFIVNTHRFTDEEVEKIFKMLKAFTCNFGDHIGFEKFKREYIVYNNTRIIERLKSIEQLNAFMSGAIKANNKMFKVWED